MSSPKGTEETINPKLIRQLADILKDTDLSEIEVEQGALKIRVARQVTSFATNISHSAPLAVPSVSVPTETAPAIIAPKSSPTNNPDTVKSPMVGTVYMQSQPGSPPFVKVGDDVKAGQTVLIVEAMKTMNSIAAPKAGKVTEIFVSDGQPVEFGAPLMIIEG